MNNDRNVAAEKWSTALPQWAIPERIFAQAPTSPWIHPVESFRPEGDLYVSTPSRHRALEALPDGGSVLDIGCGGGRAAFGLTPPARRIVGVDHQAGMLEVFAAEAHARGVDVATVLGDWPDVADRTPTCDVVTCHHVFYNVANLAPFVEALTSHARRRVVVELPQRHPLSSMSPMWKHFWDLDRPTDPTGHDALAVVESTGVRAHLELFDVAVDPRPVTDRDVEFTRIRLCLTADRDMEIRRYMEEHPVTTRPTATIWWDV
jgi:SAM-dependent methyltransferase